MSIVKFLWLGYLIVILFFRYSFEGKILILIYSIVLALVTIVNAIKSRNEWRDVAEDYHKKIENEK